MSAAGSSQPSVEGQPTLNATSLVATNMLGGKRKRDEQVVQQQERRAAGESIVQAWNGTVLNQEIPASAMKALEEGRHREEQGCIVPNSPATSMVAVGGLQYVALQGQPNLNALQARSMIGIGGFNHLPVLGQSIYAARSVSVGKVCVDKPRLEEQGRQGTINPERFQADATKFQSVALTGKKTAHKKTVPASERWKQRQEQRERREALQTGTISAAGGLHYLPIPGQSAMNALQARSIAGTGGMRSIPVPGQPSVAVRSEKRLAEKRQRDEEERQEVEWRERHRQDFLNHIPVCEAERLLRLEHQARSMVGAGGLQPVTVPAKTIAQAKQPQSLPEKKQINNNAKSVGALKRWENKRQQDAKELQQAEERERQQREYLNHISLMEAERLLKLEQEAIMEENARREMERQQEEQQAIMEQEKNERKLKRRLAMEEFKARPENQFIIERTKARKSEAQTRRYLRLKEEQRERERKQLLAMRADGTGQAATQHHEEPTERLLEYRDLEEGNQKTPIKLDDIEYRQRIVEERQRQTQLISEQPYTQYILGGSQAKKLKAYAERKKAERATTKESKQPVKKTRQVSATRSLAQKARKAREKEQRENERKLAAASVTVPVVKPPAPNLGKEPRVRVQPETRYASLTEDERYNILLRRGQIKERETQHHQGGVSINKPMQTPGKKPSRRTRKKNSTGLDEEDPFGGQYKGEETACIPRYMGRDAVCGDQMCMEDKDESAEKGPERKEPPENDYDMSLPPPDTSSDDYTDYYDSDDDDAFLKDTPIFPISAKGKNTDRVDLDEHGRHYLGKMEHQCRFCGALHWIDEKTVDSSLINPIFTKCCREGQIRLPDLREPPQALRNLFEGDDPQSRLFRKNLRSLNSANAFTSLGCKYDTRLKKGSGPQCFSIHGELRHYSSYLIPKNEKDAIYSQLFLYDSDRALAIREQRNPHLSREVLRIVQETLRENHVFYPKYLQARDLLEGISEDSGQKVQVSLHFNSESDKRRYNMPTVEEVSVIVPEDDKEIKTTRDIILHLKEGSRPDRISECHPAYLPLHYVLFFSYGELGWSCELTHWDKDLKDYGYKSLTLMEFYAYRLFPRVLEYSTILRGCKLFQEFLVDAWASTEQNRLSWVRFNQKKLRADQYASIIKMKEDGIKPEKGGTPCVLPSTHIGGHRHMYEIYQDSMAITRYHHHPDLFITMTANPNWREIQDELYPNQSVTDRPDLVARVFELKRKALMDEIVKKKIFGNVVAYVYTIEFQKRGLPHMHALIFLEKSQKIRTVDQVDSIVSAEFPSEKDDPVLFDTVKKCMVHGPCGDKNKESPCMRKGKCTKHYPKNYNDVTCLDGGGYPVYRRRDDGVEVIVKGGRKATNIDVVPYNPHLLRMFNCHINVEVCAGIRAVKYINKYIYKGYDKTTFVYGSVDEIQIYIDARYIGPPEAAWRLFGYHMHRELPHVERLAIHLPGQQRIVYESEAAIEGVTQSAENYKSKLMAYFEYNAEHPDEPAYTYQDYPQHFVWQKDRWQTRKKQFAIARMYFVSPTAGELFYLRLLLTVVAGAKSFEDLRTVKGELQPTYKKACIELGLLVGDGQWVACLREAGDIKIGSQLRNLFKIILSDCNPAEPEKLWEEFKHKICDDLHNVIKKKYGILEPTDNQIEDYGLYLIDKMLRVGGKEMAHFSSMPQPEINWDKFYGNRYICEHRQMAAEIDPEELDKNIKSLNEEQLAAFKAITDSVNQRDGRKFFLNGSAGTGKTFVYNTVAANCRLKGDIVLTVASSGIASLLLDGGRTAHSTFKIPIEIRNDSVCSIAKQKKEAEFIKQASLIIWDEVSMQHKYCVETVNRLLQDIHENKEDFGGVTVVMGGDFRQTLPVIPNGGRAEIVGACIRRSFLWDNITVLTLTKNMRLDMREPENRAYADFLLKVGSEPVDMITLPDAVKVCKDRKDLITKLYPCLTKTQIWEENQMSYEEMSEQELTERMILTARNDDVYQINTEAMQFLEGETHTYLAADRLLPNESGRIPPITNEFMQNLNPPGMPLFKLEIKVGCPVILMRNLAPSEGLCNGTRLLVTHCGKHVIQAKILTGRKRNLGDLVMIPRISFQPSISELNINMVRHQFPLRVAYAMTINKSQGQSVQHVGIDLKTPVFCHGQLYVALSRCTAARRITVLPEDKSEDLKATNVVFQDVLL